MDLTQPLIAFLTGHVHLAVFVASAIEATGIPFPSRILLILAGVFLASTAGLAGAVVLAAAGAVVGDHILYLSGRRGGTALLKIYCRLSLGSERCVENTVAHFIRFGAPAIMLARFSTGLRLFAAILSGCGHIDYPRFLAYDIAGSLLYASLWITLGHLFGAQVVAVLAWVGRRRALLLIVPAGIAALLAYRLWRRWRYGAAQPPAATGPDTRPACASNIETL
jgi:membrane protein DedA with SNARE-associated domain